MSLKENPNGTNPRIFAKQVATVIALPKSDVGVKNFTWEHLSVKVDDAKLYVSNVDVEEEHDVVVNVTLSAKNSEIKLEHIHLGTLETHTENTLLNMGNNVNINR